MVDSGIKFTDNKVKIMERHLHTVYSEAEKTMRKSLLAFAKTIAAQSAKLLKAVGEAQDQKEKQNAKNAYIQFYMRLAKSKDYKELSAFVAGNMYKTNQNIAKYINGHTAAIYAENFNYISSDIGLNIRDYIPLQTSAEDAEKYGNITQQTVDEQTDKEWNEKNLKSAIIGGAIMLLSANKIANHASKSVVRKNNNLANQHAQGMASDAETKGRLDAMFHASDTGHPVLKTWRAVRDNRTRDAHATRDGKTIGLDKEFAPGLSRPRDPHGAMAEICNCRCTLIYDAGQKKGETMAAREGDVKGSYKKPSSFKGTKTVNVPEMTYKEWAKWRGL